MKSLLEDEVIKSQILETDYFGKVTPADMAVGWPAGMKLLCDSEFDLDDALELAIHVKDLETTNIILTSEHFPSKQRSWPEILGLLQGSSREIQSVVIRDLAQR